MITDYITYLWGRLETKIGKAGGGRQWGVSEEMRFETQIQNIVRFISRQRLIPLCSSVGLD
jgi:hypothetical protein